jgi:hypothetical protein
MEAPIESDLPPMQCPRCDGTIDAPFPHTCPHCGEHFTFVVDDTPQEEEPAAPQADAELDGLKIRQVIALRRGAIRARSWCLIAAAVCGVAAVQLVIKTIQNVRHTHTWGLRPTGFVLFAVGALIVASMFLRRAAELKREIDKPPPPDPASPPVFDSLSDGSQRWKNLEDVTD